MPVLADIENARKRLVGHAHVSPVLTSRTLDDRLGANVYLKCENFQKVGAFKFRGAFNAISQLSKEQRQRGIITFSSGNHGQAVASVGRALGIKTVVVMPDNAPATKRMATEQYGAEIITCAPANRERIARQYQIERGLTLVPPFDDENIIAGQGTAALEFLDQVGSLDTLLVPTGGGGLLSGCAMAVKETFPRCRVIGIEPETGDDATRSFRSKSLQSVDNCQSIADGTRTRSLGLITFPLILKYVDDMATVTEGAIIEAIQFLFFRMKLVVEPSGALPIAALLSGSVRASGKVGVIISGGNIDAPTITRVLSIG